MTRRAWPVFVAAALAVGAVWLAEWWLERRARERPAREERGD
jgi:uncharacterized membrane protein